MSWGGSEKNRWFTRRFKSVWSDRLQNIINSHGVNWTMEIRGKCKKSRDFQNTHFLPILPTFQCHNLREGGQLNTFWETLQDVNKMFLIDRGIWIPCIYDVTWVIWMSVGTSSNDSPTMRHSSVTSLSTSVAIPNASRTAPTGTTSDGLICWKWIKRVEAKRGGGLLHVLFKDFILEMA